jgi:hypothetical protein
MRRHLRYRLPRTARLGVLLLFALCLVVQPVLGALGELHENAEHAGAAAALHQWHAQPHADAHGVVPPHGTPAEEGGALHLLLHFAHCCGQSVGLAVDTLVAAGMRIDAARPLPPTAIRRLGAHLTSPFRPPINA